MKTKSSRFFLRKKIRRLGHVMTLDVAEAHRRKWNTVLLACCARVEKQFAISWRAHDSARNRNHERSGRCLWQRHGYRIEAVLKKLLYRAFGCVRNAQALAGDEGANGLETKFLFVGVAGELSEGLTRILPVSSTAICGFQKPCLHINLSDPYWKMYTIL